MVTNKIPLHIHRLLMCLMLFLIAASAAYGQTRSAAFKNHSTIDRDLSTIEYKITFEQMMPSQHAKMKTFYTQYSGYNRHIIASQNDKATVVAYISKAPLELLVNNFTKTAEYLGMQVLVRGANASISIRFIQLNSKSLPYKQW